MAMPIDSFFQEVAFRGMNSARGQAPFKEPLWRRLLRRLSPAARRALKGALLLCVAAVTAWFHTPILQFLRSAPPHKPGMADCLARSLHRSSPAERLARRAQAHARENAAGPCQRAIVELAKVAEPPVVLACLKQPEIHALRAHAFFSRFATDLEKRNGQPAAVAARTSPAR
jgi:hypothetical protein